MTIWLLQTKSCPKLMMLLLQAESCPNDAAIESRELSKRCCYCRQRVVQTMLPLQAESGPNDAASEAKNCPNDAAIAGRELSKRCCQCRQRVVQTMLLLQAESCPNNAAIAGQELLKYLVKIGQIFWYSNWKSWRMLTSCWQFYTQRGDHVNSSALPCKNLLLWWSQPWNCMRCNIPGLTLGMC